MQETPGTSDYEGINEDAEDRTLHGLPAFRVRIVVHPGVFLSVLDLLWIPCSSPFFYHGLLHAWIITTGLGALHWSFTEVPVSPTICTGYRSTHHHQLWTPLCDSDIYYYYL
ncbi:hypothetical protein F2P79_016095 [Pimephales promelas]|nr:hypothetical protein F2P79_016095 [Pimephales promelas]